MSARALRTLLRECAVLLTALAFIMAGALTPRQHAEATALGVQGGNGFVICHPDAADAGDPAKLPTDHHCDQCVACHVVGLAMASPEIGTARDWNVAVMTASGFGLSGVARAPLPFATGPPAA